MRRPVLLLLTLLLTSCSEEAAEEEDAPEEATETEALAAPDAETGRPPAGELTIESPTHGSMVESRTFQISGSSVNMKSLSSGEDTIALQEDGRWSAEVERPSGLQLLKISGESLRGPTLREETLILVGETQPPDAAVPEGVVFYISADGMGALASAISKQIDPDEVERLIQESGTLYEHKFTVLMGSGSLNVNLRSLEFDSVDATITPGDSALELEIELHGLSVVTNINMALWGGSGTATMSITADPAVIRTTIQPRIEDRELQIDAQDTSVSLQNFQPKFFSLPKGIEPQSLRNEIRKALEASLAQELERELPAELNPILRDLNKSAQIPLGPTTLTLETRASRLHIDSEGAEFAFSQSIGDSYPADAIGVLTQQSSRPAPLQDSSATLSVGDDLANRLFYEIWAKDVLSFQLSSQDGTLDARTLKALKATEATIQVKALLPPVIVGTETGFQLQAGPILATVLSPGGGYGDRLELEIAVWVDLETTLESEQIRIRQTDLTSELAIRDHNWSVPGPIITTTIRKGLDLENQIDLALDQVAIPIPELPGLELKPLAVDRAQQGGYTQGSIQLR